MSTMSASRVINCSIYALVHCLRSRSDAASTVSGKPPRSARVRYSLSAGRSSGSENAAVPSVAIRSRIGGAEASPVISRSVRPYICTRSTRPVIGHPSSSRSDRTDPVIKKLLGPGRASTARFTAASTSGTNCHSSSSSGRGTSRAPSGSARTAAASASRSRRTIVRACRAAVVVFPHARGPTMRTAGNPAKSSSIRGSTSLAT